jgi:protein SCO1/2
MSVNNKIILIGILVLSLTAILAGMLTKLRDGAINNPSLVAVTDDAFGGPFSLTNHLGQKTTEKDFENSYRLMYFGFTFCPAICPTELSKITAALNSMDQKLSARVTPIFVTVDPERDTVQKMKPYVEMFHPSLVGLTGTPEEIKGMLKTYKVYAAKVEDPSLSEYTMDHSSFIYFIAPDGRLLHIFKMEDKADVVASIMTSWISQAQQ